MTAFVVFALAGVGTYLARSVFILAVGDRRLPDSIEAALRNVGPAVLAALTTSLLVTDGVTRFLTDIPEMGAVVVAVVVAWRVKGFLWVLAAGMVVLWLLEALL